MSGPLLNQRVTFQNSMLNYFQPEKLQSYDVFNAADYQTPHTTLLWLIMFITQWERTGFGVNFQLANYSPCGLEHVC